MRVWPADSGCLENGSVKIEGPDARHIATVLRCGVGDTLKVGDGKSRVFKARIETVNKNLVVARITGRASIIRDKKPEVTLAMSICKQSVMELAVQKAVELGCKEVLPVITRRSFAEKISAAKLARLSRIAHEASKQCGRCSAMAVSEPMATGQIPSAGLRLVLWEEEKKRDVKSVLLNSGKPATVLLLVGPPGGFHHDEMKGFIQNGFQPARLGGFILKSETAAISLLAIVNYHFGKMDS
ncbi:MAG: ribosomal RNA small subunit methyltransferase E [bacterium]|nr:MAG: ribosomal RNA small subunit methyltransferase E [bacterium]